MRRTLIGLAIAASALTGCATEGTPLGHVDQVSVLGGIVYTLPDGQHVECRDWDTVTGTECSGQPLRDIPEVLCIHGFRVDGLAVACLPEGWDR